METPDWMKTLTLGDWMPCLFHEDLLLVGKGTVILVGKNEEYRLVDCAKRKSTKDEWVCLRGRNNCFITRGVEISVNQQVEIQGETLYFSQQIFAGSSYSLGTFVEDGKVKFYVQESGIELRHHPDLNSTKRFALSPFKVAYLASSTIYGFDRYISKVTSSEILTLKVKANDGSQHGDVLVLQSGLVIVDETIYRIPGHTTDLSTGDGFYWHKDGVLSCIHYGLNKRVRISQFPLELKKRPRRDFSSLFEDEPTKDVSLILKDGTIKVHSLVLRNSGCEYLRKLVTGSFAECVYDGQGKRLKPTGEIQIDGMLADFSPLVDFMYNRKTTLTMSMLEVAERMGYEDLIGEILDENTYEGESMLQILDFIEENPNPVIVNHIAPFLTKQELSLVAVEYPKVHKAIVELTTCENVLAIGCGTNPRG